MAQSALRNRVIPDQSVVAQLASRFARALVLGIAASSLLIAGAGCDTSEGKADRDVSEKLKAAQAKIAAEMTAPSDTNADLKQASAETSDSDPLKIHAKVLFADSELRLAQLMAGKVAANDMQIDRLTHEISVLAGQIDDNNMLAASFAQAGPDDKGKRAQDALTAAQTAITTGIDDKGTWVKTDAGAVPSLAAVDKLRDDLQGQVETLTKSITASMDDRNKLLDEADKMTRASEDTSSLGTSPSAKARLDQGQKAVDLYSQGADNRKKAAEISVKIEEDNAKLARAQADLAVQQGLHDSLTATKAALDAKMQSNKEGWTATQADIAKIDERSKALLGVNPVDVPKIDAKGNLKTDSTIGSKSAAIAQLVADNVKPRADAIAHFEKAISVYQEAAALAKTYSRDLGSRMTAADQTRPEQVAWKAQKESLDPNLYSFMQGDAELQKANLLAKTAAEAKLRLDQITMLKPVLTAGHLQPLVTMDETQPTNLAELIKNSQGTADSGATGSFTKANTLLQSVFTSTAPLEVRGAALADEVYLEYAWSSLESLSGDAAKAADHMSSAREHVAAAAGQQIALPSVPLALAVSSSMGSPVGAAPVNALTSGAVVTAQAISGTYRAHQGNPGDSFQATMILVLKPDMTGTMDLTLPDMTKPGQTIQNKTLGSWSLSGNSVIFIAEKLNGNEVAANDLKKKLPLVIGDGGKNLTNTVAGIDFLRE